MSDVVKAEIRAVRELKSGVTSYMEQIRAASGSARRDMAAAQANANEAVERRRADANRAVRALEDAKYAQRRAPEEQQGQHAAAVAAAEGAVQRAEHLLTRARRSSQMVSSAASDLLKVLQAAESSVDEQSSAASSMLASLDAKLSEIAGAGAMGMARHAMATLAVGAQLATSAVDVSKLAGNVSQGYLPTADHAATTSEMSDNQTSNDQQLWRAAEELKMDDRDRNRER